MALSDKDAALLAQAAKECDIDPQLVLELAGLQVDIPDANIWGAGAELGRRVASILNDYAGRERES
jgi:hypothetical protein